MKPSSYRLYEFPPGVIVRIVSSRSRVLSYFDAEYGRLAAQDAGRVDLEARVEGLGQLIGRAEAAAPETAVIGRRHKVTRWRIALAGLEAETQVVLFEAGGPMSLPYLQNFYLEPLLRFKVTQAGYALVHACSLVKSGKSVLFPAGSSVGKTTLMLRYAAGGGVVQGDNHVIVSPDGQTFAFPRRLRIHSDLRMTSPAAFRSLPAREKAWLRFSRIIRFLSLGYGDFTSRLKLEQALPGCRFAASAEMDSIFLLRAHAGSEIVGPNPLPLESLVQTVQANNAAEGAWLFPAISSYIAAHHDSVFAEMPARESAILNRAFKGLPSFEILVPRAAHAGVIAERIALLTGLSP